ncbi:hypothetical protein [Lysobacter niastensis]|uniref:Uncharacterized protein n=1 Tax=Lysobacter niastensis TaxID=380629 RepID=A0ABS0B641_9GAMM|nr:hypothetical protein [Lysobacter niastensis]MBF6024463.1 hypothetical protein [Lysobacter niastensis]
MGKATQRRTMDAFNYLAVMVSVVVGLGLTQILAGVGNFVQIRRRVKFYWLHGVWVVLLIALHLHMWWSFWLLRVVTDWTYGLFVFVLIGPAALVIASHVIVPELIDGRIDVERHYFDTRGIFFGMLACAGVWAMFIEPLTGVRTFFVGFRMLQVVGTSLMIGCAILESRRFHAIATGAICVLFVIAVGFTRLHLGQIEPRL